MLVWIMGHRPAVFFFQDKPVINGQEAVLFSQNKSAPTISHQLNEQAAEGANCKPSFNFFHDSKQGRPFAKTKQNKQT
jgi:hypothetical protein